VYLDAFVDRASVTILEHKVAMDYLASRGFGAADVTRWRIGYTRVARIPGQGSDDWKALKEDTYGFKGLEGRIIIPLRNLLGRVNGIQTRSLDKKKYTQHLMSEAKAVGAFFGLHEALPHIRRTRRVFVHEGAFNAMSFARVFPNSVAALTSFLGEQQYELLRFLADMIVIVFDKDKAGDVGGHKVSEAYGTAGFEFLTVGDSDANACLKVMGPDKFDRFIRSRVPAVLQDRG